MTKWTTLLLLITAVCRAEISIEVSTLEPVLNEQFSVQINVSVEEQNQQPEIDFKLDGLKLISSGGMSYRQKTTYIDGELKTTRDYSKHYNFSATREGKIAIRDIIAQVNGQSLRHHDVTFDVLKEKKVLDDYFVLAHPNKTQIYKGESLFLRYYLYYKNPIRSPEISEFPKLKDFTKRFLQEKTNVERVTYHGEIYERVLLYSCVLFTEKLGEVQIDPLRINIQYPVTDQRDPFSRMGFNTRYNQRNLSSEIIKVEVLDLPTNGMPAHFTGLVGEHQFELDYNRDRLIVNEPLQLTLKVKGEGNLEAMDAPEIFSHPDFEDFEKTSDLSFSQNSPEGNKTFSYMYLPRNNIELPPSKIDLSYFDPKTKTYETVSLQLPAIKVAGQASSPAEQETDQPKELKSTENYQRITQIYGPTLSDQRAWGQRILSLLNTLLALVCVGLIIFLLYRDQRRSPRDPLFYQMQEIQRQGASYQQLYDFLDKIPVKGRGTRALSERIKNSGLQEKTKQYLLESLTKAEKMVYGEGSTKKISLKQKYLTEFYQYIKKKNLDEGPRLPWENQS